MINKSSILVTVLGIFMTLTTRAETVLGDLTIGTPGYAGSGCPAGSLSPERIQITALTGPQGQSGARLTVRPDFMVEVDTVGRTKDIRNCQIAVPVAVVETKRLSLSNARLEGRHELPPMVRGMATLEVFFALVKGPVFTQSLMPIGKGGVIDIHSQGPLLQSKCGDSTNVRAATTVLLETKAGRGTAVVNTFGMDVFAENCP